MNIEDDYLKLPDKIVRSEIDSGSLKFKDYFSTPPMFFTKNFDNVPLIDRYNGGHAFLIAGGPSFKNIDKIKLSYPGVLTMGINNSPASFRPNLWTCVDSPSNFLASIWLDPKIEKIVPMSHINKKLFDSSKWKESNKIVGDCPNVFYYRRNEVFNYQDYLFEDTINWGNHSDIGGGRHADINGGRSVFLVAMRMLYLMGIRNLYLLGVDLHMDRNNCYHFEQNRTRGSINGNMSTYKSIKRWMGELKEIFDKVGYNIHNCNPDSALEVFPYLSFDDAINKATNEIPQNEKTEGMYEREAELEKSKKLKQAKIEAAKYSDREREISKRNLDECRKLLNNLKEMQCKIIQTKFENHRQCYLWAHKLKRPEDSDMCSCYDELKRIENIKDYSCDDEFMMKLYESQIKINDTRVKLKELEIIKNKIWGIVR